MPAKHEKMQPFNLKEAWEKKFRPFTWNEMKKDIIEYGFEKGSEGSPTLLKTYLQICIIRIKELEANAS